MKVVRAGARVLVRAAAPVGPVAGARGTVTAWRTIDDEGVGCRAGCGDQTLILTVALDGGGTIDVPARFVSDGDAG